jgi:hypothetical protein
MEYHHTLDSTHPQKNHASPKPNAPQIQSPKNEINPISIEADILSTQDTQIFFTQKQASTQNQPTLKGY